MPVLDQLKDLVRTHTCGELRPNDVGSEVVMMGWIHKVRDMGSLIFFDLRDREGITQVVARDVSSLLAKAKSLRPEFIVIVRGTVELRSSGTVNDKLDTGAVEVTAVEILLLNESKTPPFQIANDSQVAEDVRLKYRYLDLRRPRMLRNLHLRHRITLAIRNHLDSKGFWEIETPILNKSTPEGARDYLVPSRVHPGELYALPQSPQIFKQILMIAGTDRYFQIARCFRDEDLRADRQPEFTQVDIEMSFATPEIIFELVERLMIRVLEEVGQIPARPFRKITYAESIACYGSDKPDLRCELVIKDLSGIFKEAKLAPFRKVVQDGGAVRGFVIPGGAGYSRRELDDLVDEAVTFGAKGLVWVRRSSEGVLQSPVMKVIGEDLLSRALTQADADADGLLVMVADEPTNASKVLGQLRLARAKRDGLLDSKRLAFAWVVDFPLLEWDEEAQRYVSMHHPFTAPFDEDIGRLKGMPGQVRAKAYDLVLNGNEIGGGSIRIHDSHLQRRIFQLLNIGNEEAERRFGFFLESLQYGTPPHGGIALGLDRIVAILAGEASIREVIAFPKTTTAVDLMAGAPSTVDSRQLRDLNLRVDS